MDFSYLNVSLWDGLLQFCILCLMLLLANILRRKVAFFRRSLIPTAVLAGFLTLILRYVGIMNLDPELLEAITYHAIALGFIALALKTPKKHQGDKERLVGLRSGALIVSTYVVQSIAGILITVILSLTVMPQMFPAAGALLSMAYGQGPGQANNVGSSYEQLGFVGGQSFGLALAATGFLVACIVGVIYLTCMKRKGKINVDKSGTFVFESMSIDQFQDKNEVPISESVDRFSLNTALILLIYFATYWACRLLTLLFDSIGGFAASLVSIVWGFNFIIGAALAILCRIVFKSLHKTGLMTRQYQNNYLLSRISGTVFDFMVIAGIASINIENLSGLWLPFLILAVVGGVLTFVYLQWICRKLYPDYYYESFVSMFGMLTGTISSGVLLLREIDSDLSTPASNNLLIGTSFAIMLGAPILILIGLAPSQPWLVLGVLAVYLVALLALMLKIKRRDS